MPKYKKLIIAGLVLVIVPAVILLINSSLLSCEGPYVALFSFLTFLNSAIVHGADFLILTIPVGLLTLVVGLLLWERSRGTTVMSIVFEVFLCLFLLAFAVLFVASLNSTRDKGVDAAVKSSLHSLRDEAAIYYDWHSRSYEGLCSNSQSIASTLERVTNTPLKQGMLCKKGTQGEVSCYEDKENFAASTVLLTKENRGKYFCVDSTGFAGVTDTSATGTACPK